MVLGLKGTLFVVLMALIALCGCEEATNFLADALSPDAPVIEATPDEEITMESPPSEPIMEVVDVESVPVKMVWLINYPLGGKEDYVAWIASVAPMLLAPEELNRLHPTTMLTVPIRTALLSTNLTVLPMWRTI